MLAHVRDLARRPARQSSLDRELAVGEGLEHAQPLGVRQGSADGGVALTLGLARAGRESRSRQPLFSLLAQGRKSLGRTRRRRSRLGAPTATTPRRERVAVTLDGHPRDARGRLGRSGSTGRRCCPRRRRRGSSRAATGGAGSATDACTSRPSTSRRPARSRPAAAPRSGSVADARGAAPGASSRCRPATRPRRMRGPGARGRRPGDRRDAGRRRPVQGRRPAASYGAEVVLHGDARRRDPRAARSELPRSAG